MKGDVTFQKLIDNALKLKPDVIVVDAATVQRIRESSKLARKTADSVEGDD